MAGLQCRTRTLARLGTPQGPTNLQVHQASSSPDMLTGVFRALYSTREQQPAAPPMEPIAAEGFQLEEEQSVVFGCPEKGCIKVYQSHSSLQRHLDAGKHLLALERESPRTKCSRKSGQRRASQFLIATWKQLIRPHLYPPQFPMASGKSHRQQLTWAGH